MRVTVLLTSFLAAFAFSAFAQEGDTPVTLTVTESETYGPYLTDSEGNSLYLFVNEEMEMGDGEGMTEGVRANAAPCSGGCLEAWPPLTAETLEAGEGVDPELLYTADVDGMMMAVYNGWPLYYFARDEAPGDTNGQDVGGAPNIWYLVTPEGTPVEEAGTDGETGGGETGGG